MADDNNAPSPQHTSAETGRDGERGGRGPQREPGGFRIRLSDNEMRAVRAVQDAFNLRSPVAALGFSVRSIAQLLEQGQLDELVAQQRAQGASRQPDGPRGGGGGGRPAGGRRPMGEGRQERSAPRIDPLARPQKPAPASVTITESGSESGSEPEPTPADSASAAIASVETASEEAISAPAELEALNSAGDSAGGSPAEGLTD